MIVRHTRNLDKAAETRQPYQKPRTETEKLEVAKAAKAGRADFVDEEAVDEDAESGDEEEEETDDASETGDNLVFKGSDETTSESGSPSQ